MNGMYEKGWLWTLNRVIVESLTEKGTLYLRLPVSRTHQELAVLRAFAQHGMLFLQISKAFSPPPSVYFNCQAFPDHILLLFN